MFRKKSREQEKVDTIIHQGTSIEGVVFHESSIRVDGKIKGKLVCKGDVYLGSSGYIENKIEANNIIISGEAVGNLYAKESVHIQETGSLTGKVKATGIMIDKGGVFNGESSIVNKDEGSTERKELEAKDK